MYTDDSEIEFSFGILKTQTWIKKIKIKIELMCSTHFSKPFLSKVQKLETCSHLNEHLNTFHMRLYEWFYWYKMTEYSLNIEISSTVICLFRHECIGPGICISDNKLLKSLSTAEIIKIKWLKKSLMKH